MGNAVALLKPSKLVKSARKPPNAGKGRKKGVPNKVTASIKAAFLEAFDQRGGVTALLSWAEKEETEFYKLAARLIPTEVAASGTLTLEALVAGSWKSRT